MQSQSGGLLHRVRRVSYRSRLVACVMTLAKGADAAPSLKARGELAPARWSVPESSCRVVQSKTGLRVGPLSEGPATSGVPVCGQPRESLGLEIARCPEPELPVLRSDVAPVFPRRKASVGEATRALADNERRRSARDKLEERKLAFKSKRAEAARWKTLESIGRAASPPLQLCPVTVEVIHDMAAALMAGGYRSGELYLGTLRKRHVKEGHAWPEELTLAMQEVKRAMRRGRGPDKKAPEFDLPKLAQRPGALSPR